MSKENYKRYRDTSITFRLTSDERDAVHYRARVLGIPLQEMFLKTFMDQSIEVSMGMFDSERVAIELRKLRKVIDTLPADDEQLRDDIRKCRICLEQILEVFRIRL
jgi:hypothetical protein